MTTEQHGSAMHIVGVGIAVGADGGHAHTLQADTLCTHAVSCGAEHLTAFALSDDCRTVALGHGGRSGHVHVLRLRADLRAVEADDVHDLPAGMTGPWAGACVPGGQLALAGCAQGAVAVNLHTGETHTVARWPAGAKTYVPACAISACGAVAAFGRRDGTVRVHRLDGALRDVEADTLIIRHGDHWINSVSFSVCGRHIAIGARDGRIAVYDALTGAQERIVAEGCEGLAIAAYTPDWRSLAHTQPDKTLCWSLDATLAGIDADHLDVPPIVDAHGGIARAGLCSRPHSTAAATTAGVSAPPPKANRSLC